MVLPKLETLPTEQKEKIIFLKSQQQTKKEIPEAKKNSKCFVCGSSKKLLVHHIKYWPPQEIILCEICHLLIHARDRRGHYVITTAIPDRTYYEILKKRPLEEQERVIERTFACHYGKCQDCLDNCAIRQLKMDHIKIKTQENKRRWINA